MSRVQQNDIRDAMPLVFQRTCSSVPGENALLGIGRLTRPTHILSNTKIVIAVPGTKP